MEVHAHTHTPRKKWTHYFWEFFMLFLAVTLGFFVENQREHMIEKNRELQYMQSLLEDLHNDTAEIRSQYELGEQQKIVLDSVVTFVNTQEISGDNISKLYSLQGNSGRVVKVEFETRTSSQLKNAGGMRLIGKKTVVDSILYYWKFIETCNDIAARLERASDSRYNISVRLFHNKYYVRGNAAFIPVAGTTKGAKLITNDEMLLAEYSNRTYARSIVLSNYLVTMIWTKERAVRLMEILRKAYHLK